MATWSYSSVYVGSLEIGGFQVDGPTGNPAGTFSESTIDSSFAIGEVLSSSNFGSIQFEGFTAEGNVIFTDFMDYYVAVKTGNATTYTNPRDG